MPGSAGRQEGCGLRGGMTRIVVKLEIQEGALAAPDARNARDPLPPCRPIRVCYLIDDLGTGGTEGQLLSLIQRVDRTRVEPHLCLLRGLSRRSRSLEPDNCTSLRLGVGALRSPKTLGKFLGFVRYLSRQSIDVLQIYFPDSTLFGVPAGRMAGVPQVLTTRVNLAPIPGSFRRWLVRRCTRRAHGVIANSPMCRQAALDLDGAEAAAVHVIENGVDLARFDAIPAMQWTGPSRPQRIGLLANL